MRIPADDFDAFADKLAKDFEQVDATPALKDCIPIIIGGIEQHFLTATSPEGRPWPPRMDNQPHPLLIKSGKLKAAATGGPGNIAEITGNELRFGVSKEVVIYAAVHQFGYAPNNIPQRKYLGMDAGVKRQCEKVIGDFVFTEVFG